MSQAGDETSRQIAAIEALFDGYGLPDTVRKWLKEDEVKQAFGLPLLGLPIGPDPDNSWGATQLLRVCRPDLSNDLLVVRLLGDQALCLNLSETNGDGTPLFEVILEPDEAPRSLEKCFEEYIVAARKDLKSAERVLNQVDELVKRSRTRYAHDKGGKIPRAHKWRVFRSCVHDWVVGIVGLKQSEQWDATAVAVFETSDHPLYEAGHGVRSLLSLVLADAYKTGGSMRVFFIKDGKARDKQFQGRSIPACIVELASKFGIKLTRVDQGMIEHGEGVALFAALSGLSESAIQMVRAWELDGRLTVQGVSHLVNTRVWTAEETEWILSEHPSPSGLLFGDDVPDDWIAYVRSLNYGRAAVLATIFRASLNDDGEEGIDKSQVSVRKSAFQHTMSRPATVEWVGGLELKTGDVFTVLPRPRQPLGFEPSLAAEDAKRLASMARENSHRFLLYTEESRHIDLSSIQSVLNETGVTIAVAPYTLRDLDEIVEERLTRARRVRR